MGFLLGILVSLITTLLWFSFLVLFDICSRKKIDYLLEMSIDCAELFQYSIEHSDYLVAMSLADRLLDLLIDINNNIKVLTYSPKKKKLILTYLYNALNIVSVFKNLTVGYEEKTEHNARCEKFNKKYLYIVKLNENYNKPFLALSLSIVQALNKVTSVEEALIDNFEIRDFSIEQKKNIYLNLVAAKSFNMKNNLQHFMRNTVFTREEYENYIIMKLESE